MRVVERRDGRGDANSTAGAEIRRGGDNWEKISSTQDNVDYVLRMRGAANEKVCEGDNGHGNHNGRDLAYPGASARLGHWRLGNSPVEWLW